MEKKNPIEKELIKRPLLIRWDFKVSALLPVGSPPHLEYRGAYRELTEEQQTD